MVLNPFEGKGKEYDLRNILYRDELGYFDIKHPYDKIFPELDYDTLLKSINTEIDWHKYILGDEHGDIFYGSNYNNKWYFVITGYGSCPACDVLQAADGDLNALMDLQDSIISSIREFDSLMELVNWVDDSVEYWYRNKQQIIDWINAEFYEHNLRKDNLI